jgi:hypothetical protein
VPKISKIRITGAKYDNFRKGYEDQIFDLTRNDEPDHTLFTLVNQGGKGVLMQLISQIAIPGTRWGRESGNQLISMFYDRHRNFSPYTFHVILEWKLDTVPEKWLITGVCITAEKRFTSEEQADRTGLNYFHYTIEHDKKGFFSAETLPVYNNRDKRPADYDEFEKFIDDNGKYIVKYPMSQTRRINSRYFEYLRSRGIYKEEWDIMKAINRHEGGVSSYFSSAADNKSVIDKMIIPAITQNMSNYSENAGESLKDMFLSNLSITRDLPHLLERESDYRELILMMSPLIECAREGEETQKKLRSHINEGNNILYTLNNSMEKVLDKKKNWENALKETEAELEQYNFESENLEYARYKREEKEKRDRVEKVDEEISNYKEELLNTQQLKIETQADILLVRRRKHLEERKKAQEERQYLVENMQLKNLKNEMEKLENIIKEKWVINKRFFEEISFMHNEYQKQLNLKKEQLDEIRRREERRLTNVKAEIIAFEERKKVHKKAFKELTQYFDPFSLSLPELLLSELKEESEKRKSKTINLQTVIKETEDSLIRIKNDIYEGELNLKSVKENLKREEENYNQAQKEEKEITYSLCKILGLEQTSIIYTHNWAKDRLKDIDGVIERERQRLDELKARLWEINTDLNINCQEYWIPNSDILKLKESIGAIGIGPVQTGTEFLSEIVEEEDRKRLIEETPLLPYGIVIPSQREWELMERNLGKDLFLRVAVPIFIRKEMDLPGVRSVFNLGHKLALNQEEFQNWYSGLNEKTENIKETIKVLEQKLENLFSVKDNILRITSRPESNSILKIINDIKVEISSIEKYINCLETELEKTREKLQEYNNELKNFNEIEEREEEKIRKVENYVSEDNAIKERQVKIDELILAEKDIQNTLDGLEQKKNRNSEYILEDRSRYAAWKINLGDRLKELKRFIDSVYVDYNSEKKEYGSCQCPPEYDSEGIDGIFEDVNKRLSLETEIHQRNSQIKVLSGVIKIVKGQPPLPVSA